MVQNAPAEASAAPEASAPNVVRLPDGHTVTLHPSATPDIASAIIALINEGAPSQAVMFGRLATIYLHLGIASWDYPEPVSDLAIRSRITVANGSQDVAEAADALYLAEVAQGPLAVRLSKRSRPTPTGSSTPPASPSGPSPRTPPGRSSRNGTAGKRSAAPVP